VSIKPGELQNASTLPLVYSVGTLIVILTVLTLLMAGLQGTLFEMSTGQAIANAVGTIFGLIVMREQIGSGKKAKVGTEREETDEGGGSG
jgi:ABC-type nitrate/sulfonate/bicarbonate transport system permease component